MDARILSCREAACLSCREAACLSCREAACLSCREAACLISKSSRRVNAWFLSLRHKNWENFLLDRLGPSARNAGHPRIIKYVVHMRLCVQVVCPSVSKRQMESAYVVCERWCWIWLFTWACTGISDVSPCNMESSKSSVDVDPRIPLPWRIYQRMSFNTWYA